MNETRCPNCMSPIPEGAAFCSECGARTGSTETSPHQMPPGTVLMNRYVVGKVLGEGGFGITYLGYDNHLDSKVAIKEYFPRDRASRDKNTFEVECYTDKQDNIKNYEHGKEKFMREARMMAKMEKQQVIVGVRDFFEANGTAYIIMEFIEGETLVKLTQKSGGRISPDVLFPLLQPIFGALAAFHSQGLIHRDISPDNIMIEDGMIRLIDFGVSRENDESAETSTITLKHGYAPIEQFQVKGQGVWTDIYSLAATIYYCLTGEPPTRSIDRVTGLPLKRPSEYGVNLHPQQEEALLKALSIKAEDRYQSMLDMYNGLYSVYSAAIPQFTQQTVQQPVQEQTLLPPKPLTPADYTVVIPHGDAVAQQAVQPPQQPAYTAQQPVQPPQQPAYAAQQPVQPPQQPAYTAQQPVQPPQQPAYTAQQPVQPPQQPAYNAQPPQQAAPAPANNRNKKVLIGVIIGAIGAVAATVAIVLAVNSGKNKPVGTYEPQTTTAATTAAPATTAATTTAPPETTTTTKATTTAATTTTTTTTTTAPPKSKGDASIVAGNTAGNIMQGGIFTQYKDSYFKVFVFDNYSCIGKYDPVDNDYDPFVDGEAYGFKEINNLCALSDNIVYFISNGFIYKADNSSGGNTIIDKKDFDYHDGNISRFFLTSDYLFIEYYDSSTEKYVLGRNSLSTGECEEEIYLSSYTSFIITNGFLYCIDIDSTNGESTLFKIDATDFSNVVYSVFSENQKFNNMSTDGKYIYVTNFDYELYRFDLDLSLDNYMGWGLSNILESTGKNYLSTFNVYKDHVFILAIDSDFENYSLVDVKLNLKEDGKYTFDTIYEGTFDDSWPYICIQTLSDGFNLQFIIKEDGKSVGKARKYTD